MNKARRQLFVDEESMVRHDDQQEMNQSSQWTSNDKSEETVTSMEHIEESDEINTQINLSDENSIATDVSVFHLFF